VGATGGVVFFVFFLAEPSITSGDGLFAVLFLDVFPVEEVLLFDVLLKSGFFAEGLSLGFKLGVFDLVLAGEDDVLEGADTFFKSGLPVVELSEVLFFLPEEVVDFGDFATVSSSGFLLFLVRDLSLVLEVSPDLRLRAFSPSALVTLEDFLSEVFVLDFLSASAFFVFSIVKACLRPV